MKVIGWKTWYDNRKIYSSKKFEWKDLPYDGVLQIIIFYDEKNAEGYPKRRIMAGSDFYFLMPGKRGSIFGQSDDSKQEIKRRYPRAKIKRGRWTDDDTMEWCQKFISKHSKKAREL